MNRIGLFPGTFDPPSLGHLDIIQKSLISCDHLIVAVAHKPDKKSQFLFSLEEKIEMLRLITKSNPQIEITSFHGLTVEYARMRKVSFLIRGLRAFSDFESEFQMAIANRKLGQIETLFLLPDERHVHISSSLIREIASFKGSLHDFVPKEIEPLIHKKLGN
ncbi:MAG: pantetheine-phosphate adenylyltransferase [Chlamydiota bacterium]